MNKTLQIIFFITCFTFSTSLFSEEITIVYAKHSSHNQDKPSSNQIIEIEKIKKIAERNNINVKIKGLPWKRALLMLEKGLIDGVINASYKKERANYSVYPMKNDVLDNEKRLNDGNTYYIYRHKDSLLRWNGKVFLKGGKVGVKEKYAVINDLKKHKNITINEFVKNSEIIRKLSVNKLDGYAGGQEEVKSLLEKYIKFSENIVKEPIPIRKKSYFLIFSKKTYTKKSKEIEQIWQGLKEYNLKNRSDKI